MKNKALYILLLFCVQWMVSSCNEDLLFTTDPSGQGVGNVSFNLDFKSMDGVAVGSRTKGDAIERINTLRIIIYKEGKLFMNQKIENFTSPKLVNTSMAPGKPETPPADEDYAQDETYRTTFGLPDLPYGIYRIYAVVNVRDLSDDEVETEEKLRSVSCTWNSGNVAANNQMFGMFMDSENTYSDDTEVTINQKETTLHAWVKRLASKVTVAYDGSRLNENIFIYLKSVQIKDIPLTCSLGNSNTPSSDDDLIHEGEKITYSTATDHNSWPRIAKGNPTYGNHEKDSPNSLFFYENKQGEGKDKRQDANGDGLLDAPGYDETVPTYSKKDGKPYGTYIEVKAYYVNQASGEVSSGNITYRFMLGKDIITDYDAERNMHYKLTLMFNGNANDVDWHIEYKEDPGIYVPNPYYISYLYNQQMTLPIKISGTITGNVNAEIIDNNWSPDGGIPGQDYYGGTVTGGIWNGFLSLVKPKYVVIDTGEKAQGGNEFNKKVWEGAWPNDQRKRGERTYSPTPGNHSDNENGDYQVELLSNGSKSFNIPLFTRAKQLTITTGYTGNNIYTSFNRTAVVKLTAVINGQTVTKEVKIIQVKRIVNPLGIWRKHDNSEAFNVTLMEQPEENSESFTPVISNGPWKASVESTDGNWITLKGLNGSQLEGEAIKGATGSKIEFVYQPNGTIGNSEVRCGIIKVEYNNYTCVHRILVRQGYAPLALGTGGRKWHSYNLYSKTQETNSPLEEGSLFKAGNLDDAILATNNTKAQFNVLPKGNLALAGKGGKSWSDIPPVNHNREASFQNVTINGKSYSVAEFKDWDYLNQNCDFGYGVLYGDDATSTASTATAAYEYVRDGNATYGMRGCFVYNAKTGSNVFFPIGASGFGRRVDKYNGKTAPFGELRYGGPSQALHDYGSTSAQYRPLLDDLYRSQGAIYWCKAVVVLDNNSNNPYYDSNFGNKLGHRAWDINYKTLDFNSFKSDCWPDSYYTREQIGTSSYKTYGSDACFIRCVE